MSEYGVEGPPEQETDMTKANTRASDKWAHWEAGRPAWSADLLVGPTALNLPRGGSSLDA